MDKKIILPGAKISDGRLNIPNTYSDGTATYAAVIGTMDGAGHYLPLETRYRAYVGDVVIGVVVDSIHAGYRVALNLPQSGFIPTRNIKIDLQLGDFVLCKIRSVSEVGDVDLGEVRRLPRGKLIKFPSAKVPRLIGRKSSMLMLLKTYAGGDLMVGNNGYVWLSDKSNIPLLLKAISHIERKAHKSGLTDEIANLLKEETGLDLPVPQGETYE
ncbi:hypothetical protein HY990_00765 [Candidatus Micrarchaeota archaeon]|nr:hypothetical protein [Candidatus Micrarchaeota archaeon]